MTDPRDALHELNIEFPDEHHVIVSLNSRNASRPLPFVSPLTAEDHKDLRWYLEIYGAHSLGDPDDRRAHEIVARLPELGRALFQAALGDPEALLRYHQFLLREEGSRLLTVSAERPEILALPWELLHGPTEGSVPFFLERPSISIRRRVLGASDGREPFTVHPKDTLRLLFIVSRPDDAGFLDPRADTAPTLDAIDEHAPGRVVCEFLRPPTLDALLARLDDTSKPPIDVLHFDGHGFFDRRGDLPRRLVDARARRSVRVEDILREENHRKVGTPTDPDAPPNTGYLLFEDRDHRAHPVSARKLGENLHRRKIALIILSACQSAAIGGSAVTEDVDDADEAVRGAMGSVAARLTAAGIPSVLAMTHAVLVSTTRALFGVFYQELAKHGAVGASLDLARRHLHNHPGRYEVPRDQGRVTLKLHDWFLPALYQPGEDGPLLAAPSQRKKRKRGSLPSPVPRTNLPPVPEAGFFGRRHDLWDIERWFVDGTRRITLTGFGGQGKTALAHEAARWLLRSGMFEAAVFVDYAAIQSLDAVAIAVLKIASVLGKPLLDVDATTRALRHTPTLVILDNLEALPAEALRELLDVAVAWSEADGSRLLCTTRTPSFEHENYRVEGTNRHRRIQLSGLGSRPAPDDALEWYASLIRLPPAPAYVPKRTALIELFELVRFHPLSIRVLAQQLKTRRPAELGERLGALLTPPSPHHDPDTPPELLASLQLSLDHLDEVARRVLPSLGVFRGGAFEHDLVAITGIGDSGERARLEQVLADMERGDVRAVLRASGMPEGAEVSPEQFAQVEAQLPELVETLRGALALIPEPSADLWPLLRQQLEAAALIEAERVPGVGFPFLRFHPMLAPMLWTELPERDRARLRFVHRVRYFAVSRFLYSSNDRNPQEARAIAIRDLPNLIHAAHDALDAAEPMAAEFTDNVNRFLTVFGLDREAAKLSKRAEVAQANNILVQVNLGERKLNEGRVAEAESVFQALLSRLEGSLSYERAVVLGHLGRCFMQGGRLALASQAYQNALSTCDGLSPTDDVRRLHGVVSSDLGNLLAQKGDFAKARRMYEASLDIGKALGDPRQQGVVLAQLGNLAYLEKKLDTAAEKLNDALSLFKQLSEPLTEATTHHQLGLIYQAMHRWDDADMHYRKAARIKEDHGMISGVNGAANTWHQLGILSILSGRPDAAEDWLRKVITSHNVGVIVRASSLSNIASLLRGQPTRLSEARSLAEEALALKMSMDPDASEIWRTYTILAEIAETEADSVESGLHKSRLRDEARSHRRNARDAKRAYPGTRHGLRAFLPLIDNTVRAVLDENGRDSLEQDLSTIEQRGWTKLAAAVRQTLAGERDADVLCDSLDPDDSMIIETILRGLVDPSTLEDLRAPPAPAKNS